MDKRQIAAIAGVLHYLRRETEIRVKEHARPSPYTLSGRWAIYGRKTIMHLRSRVQRRILDTHIPLPFINISVSCRGFAMQRLKKLAITQKKFKLQAPVYLPKEKTVS